jgi:hypothetical protein
MLDKCVQRLKSATVEPDSERNTVEVRFVTKDDNGYYEYRLGVPVPEDEAEDHE